MIERYIAILHTARHLERPFQFFGSDRARTTKQAEDWLEANGQHGDSIEITQLVREPVCVVECKKPAPGPAVRIPKDGHHAFVEPKYGVRCDKCNKLEEEHF